MEKQKLAELVYKTAYIIGQFKLRSGVTSGEYFDKYLFESDPRILSAMAERMSYLMPAGVDFIAGLEMGGIPIATRMSSFTFIPTVFVRKKRKEYGTRNIIEGGDVEGRHVVVVEDVITTAGQVIESVQELRKAGACVKRVICAIDREQGGEENLVKQQIILRPLFTMSQMRDVG